MQSHFGNPLIISAIFFQFLQIVTVFVYIFMLKSKYRTAIYVVEGLHVLEQERNMYRF